MSTTDFVPPKFSVDVTDYVWILRRHFVLVAVIFVMAFTAMTFLVSRQQPIYESSCLIKISFRQHIGQAVQGPFGGSLATELQLINHDKELLSRTLNQLKKYYQEHGRGRTQEEQQFVSGLSLDAFTALISAYQRDRSDVIVLAVKGPFPTFTEYAANTLALVYRMDFAAAQTREAMEAKLFIDEQSGEIREEIQKNNKALSSYSDRLAVQGTSKVYNDELARLRIQLAHAKEKYTDAHPKVRKIIKQIELVTQTVGKLPRDQQMFKELEHDQNILQGMLRQLQELSIQADMDYKTKKAKALEDIQVIASARPGLNLTHTERHLTVILGGIFAALLSIVCALVWEGLDTSIGKIDDVERITQLPVIAQIPVIGSPPRRRLAQLIRRYPKRTRDLDRKVLFNFDSKSVAAEAYRTLRTNLSFALDETDDRVIAVTSSSPLEGKTLTATNLSLTLAQSGKSTVLVEADLRRPQIAELFRFKAKPGLSELLVGTAARGEAIRTAADMLVSDADWDKLLGLQGIDNLHILPAGAPPANALELIASDEFRTLLKTLALQYDYVIIDTPPLLPVADASIISSLADATVLIYQSDKTSRHLLMRAIQTLKKGRTRLVGIVINQLSYDVTMPRPYKYSSYSYH